jgi:hypothetical protein
LFTRGSLREGTKEGRGDSYWVGYSKKNPEGYFIRVEGNTRPKGNVVLVTLTGSEVRDLFGCYGYEEIRDVMNGRALAAGLRPPSGPAAPGRAKDVAESVRAARAVSGVPAAQDVPVVPADEVPARVLSRAERDELYGLPPAPVEVARRAPKPRPETADDVIRRLIPSYR